jgi:uncharacterized protein (DUF983 family)
MRRAKAVVLQRCPRCLQGRVFRRFMSMHERCPVCDLRFEREPGYFYGAMYFSYALAIVTTLYWVPLLILGAPLWLVIGLPSLHLLLQTPLAFRYSRVLWLHLDHRLDPEGTRGQEPPLPPGPRLPKSPAG